MKFKEWEFLPVILGGDIGTYSLARSFHEEYGIKSVAVSMTESHMCTDSSIIETILEPHMDTPEGFVEKLIAIAACYPAKKLILLACGDWYVRLIVENKAALMPYYVIPYIDEALLNQLVLKDAFYEVCDKMQVPYPRTYIYDCAQPPEKVLLPFDFPVVAKPSSSADYHYADFPGKRKVFKFGNRGLLEEMLNNLKESGYSRKFLLQDFIPGDDTCMRILTTYSDRTGRVRFMSFGQTLLEDQGIMGIGNPVAIINRVNNEVMDHARRLLESVGYTGFANFDIKYDMRDGSYRFLEINTRLGRSNYYVTGSGFNTVKWIVDDLIYRKEFDDEVVVADNTMSLYTVIPKSVLLAYVADRDLKDEIRCLYTFHKVVNPLCYRKEERFIRRVYPAVFLLKQKKRFNRSQALR